VQKKILIVDDHKFLHELLKVTFEVTEHRLVFAENGHQALKVARTERPDVILMDIMMPYTDGLEACRQLKADPLTADIPVFLLSAKTQKRDISAGFEAGAEAYITKPFSPLGLVRQVEERLTGESRLRDLTV
jgi:CheY-like chemotaxis protein